VSEAQPADNTLNLWARTGLVALSVGLVAALATAGWLAPSPQGYGTHQQLGFPACSFLRMFGRPCPSCGMTTAWAHVIRGQPLAAAQANSAGALLALAAPLVAGWAAVSAARGRWWGGRPADRWLLAAAGVLAVLVLADWLRRLATGG
jgi:hypothetical protein